MMPFCFYLDGSVALKMVTPGLAPRATCMSRASSVSTPYTTSTSTPREDDGFLRTARNIGWRRIQAAAWCHGCIQRFVNAKARARRIDAPTRSPDSEAALIRLSRKPLPSVVDGKILNILVIVSYCVGLYRCICSLLPPEKER